MPPGCDKPLPTQHSPAGKALSSRIGASLLDQFVLWRLPSAAMTDVEDRDAVRRGYWLRRAREQARVTLADAAQIAGLAAGSGSTVSLWERGQRPIKVHQMKRLAVRYGVPVSLFTDPPMTDDERLAVAMAGERQPLTSLMDAVYAEVEAARRSGGEEGARLAMERLRSPAGLAKLAPSIQPRPRGSGARSS